jgi:hypothetical protein
MYVGLIDGVFLETKETDGEDGWSSNRRKA